ncbi:hypothetical protein T10_12064 [Trichinella papuae]|uniref:Uncharacterized protein n=1 Tax=Trichinella papuae TaxID=268474 RepID=A0A0V1N7T9_9BILA|nr:hypothetical protein T10_12064 [Trichinella papuae]
MNVKKLKTAMVEKQQNKRMVTHFATNNDSLLLKLKSKALNKLLNFIPVKDCAFIMSFISSKNSALFRQNLKTTFCSKQAHVIIKLPVCDVFEALRKWDFGELVFNCAVYQKSNHQSRCNLKEMQMTFHFKIGISKQKCQDAQDDDYCQDISEFSNKSNFATKKVT